MATSANKRRSKNPMIAELWWSGYNDIENPYLKEGRLKFSDPNAFRNGAERIFFALCEEFGYNYTYFTFNGTKRSSMKSKQLKAVTRRLLQTLDPEGFYVLMQSISAYESDLTLRPDTIWNRISEVYKEQALRIVHEQCNKELGTHDVAYANESANENTYGTVLKKCSEALDIHNTFVYANPCVDCDVLEEYNDVSDIQTDVEFANTPSVTEDSKVVEVQVDMLYTNTSDMVHIIVHEQCNKELGTHDVAYANESANENTYGTVLKKCSEALDIHNTFVYANPCAEVWTRIAVVGNIMQTRLIRPDVFIVANYCNECINHMSVNKRSVSMFTVKGSGLSQGYINPHIIDRENSKIVWLLQTYILFIFMDYLTLF